MTKPDKQENTNLSLWNSLEKTDPAHTKQFKGRGGFAGTAINGTYLLKRLTETFGPCGQGWRFVLEDEQIIVGHTLKNGDQAKLHVVRGHIEYRVPMAPVPEIKNEAESLMISRVMELEAKLAWCATSPQFGQTMLVDENKYGPFTDEEAPKKSITDCISKCCVLLGLAADVHLGLFDDNKYVNQRKQEEAADKAVDVPAASKPSQAPEANQPELPTEDDMNIARSVYASVKKMAQDAKSREDLDASLKANVKGLKVLERVSPPNYDGLKKYVQARREELPSVPEHFVDDDLPPPE